MGTLEDMGWDDLWDAAWAGVADAAATVPARVVSVHRDAFVVWTAEGERSAELSGRLRHRASDEDERPAIGDWVAIRLPPGDGASIVHGVLPRRTQLARKVPGALTAGPAGAANGGGGPIAAGPRRRNHPARPGAAPPPPIASCSAFPAVRSSSTPPDCASSSSGRGPTH